MFRQRRRSTRQALFVLEWCSLRHFFFSNSFPFLISHSCCPPRVGLIPTLITMALTSLFCIEPAAFPGLISATRRRWAFACVCACASTRVGGGIGHRYVCVRHVSPTCCESDRNEKKRKDKAAAIREEGQRKAWGDAQMQVLGRL